MMVVVQRKLGDQNRGDHPARVPSDRGPLQAQRHQAAAEVSLLAVGLVLAFTATAVVNTLAMSVSERVREFALLRLAGATRRQVLSVLLLGTALGSAVSLAVLTSFSIGMTGRAAPAVTPLITSRWSPEPDSSRSSRPPGPDAWR